MQDWARAGANFAHERIEAPFDAPATTAACARLAQAHPQAQIYVAGRSTFARAAAAALAAHEDRLHVEAFIASAERQPI